VVSESAAAIPLGTPTGSKRGTETAFTFPARDSRSHCAENLLDTNRVISHKVKRNFEFPFAPALRRTLAPMTKSREHRSTDSSVHFRIEGGGNEL
jgi:hypothetical protein